MRSGKQATRTPLGLVLFCILYVSVPFNDISSYAGDATDTNGGTPVSSKTISGVVTGETGRPVAGTTVRVHCRITQPGPGKYLWVFPYKLDPPIVTTDSEGRFTLDVPGDGWHNLLLSPQDHAAEIVYDVPPDTNTLQVVLEKGGTVAGQVVYLQEGTRVPVPNVPVRIYEADRDPYTYLGEEYEREATTDEEGRFRIESLSTRKRDTLRIMIGQGAYRPREWMISVHNLQERITFAGDSEIKSMEFLLEGDVQVFLEPYLMEIQHGIDPNLEIATQVHDYIVQSVAAREGGAPAEDVIPTIESLMLRPRTTLANYIEGMGSYPDAVRFSHKLEALGWIEVSPCLPVRAQAGERIEIYLRPWKTQWQTMGYPAAPQLHIVPWPAIGKGIVDLEINLDAWAGICRPPSEPARTDELWRVVSSTWSTVRNGESLVIPLWHRHANKVVSADGSLLFASLFPDGTEDDLREDEDLFFAAVTVRIILPPGKSSEPRYPSAGRTVAQIAPQFLRVNTRFLEDLCGDGPIQGVSSVEDMGTLHEIGAAICADKFIVLTSAQVALITATAEKYGRVTEMFPNTPRNLVEGRRSRAGFILASSYVGGYDEPDNPLQQLSPKMMFFDGGIQLDMEARLLSEDNIGLDATLRVTNLKSFDERPWNDGRVYPMPKLFLTGERGLYFHKLYREGQYMIQIPRAETIVYPLNDLTVSADMTILLKTELLWTLTPWQTQPDPPQPLLVLINVRRAPEGQ